MHTLDVPSLIGPRHICIAGETGSGKSALLQLIADDIAGGFSLICPAGSARLVAARLANPAHARGRRVHVLDPTSDLSFGLNPFETEEHTWSEAHVKSLMWSSSVESLYAAAMTETVRLQRILYVLGMFACYHGLTLVELLHALSLIGERVREFMLTAFDNRPIATELEDLNYLARKSPARFLEQVESTKNRLLRWLGDKRLVRILGRAKGNLDARAVMDAGDIVLVDTSPLPAEDAAFLATIMTCRYFLAAKRRLPDVSSPHYLLIDEAAAALCRATAELLDQARKFGLFCVLSFQRLGQLQEKGPFITEAVMVNCGTKVVFRQPEPVSAHYFAEQCYTGHLDLCEWKLGSERPAAVGNEKVLLRNRSVAQHHVEQSGLAATDMQSDGRASIASRARLSSWGSAFADGGSFSIAGPPSGQPFAGPTPALEQYGRSRQRSGNVGGARSSSRAFARHSQQGHAETSTRASGDGTSASLGESEAYITKYENLPAALYSLDEQIHRAAGRIMNLANRELILKLPGQAPIHARTPDLPPAFASAEFQRLMTPRFVALTRESPYLVPGAVVDAQIEARLAAINNPATTLESDVGAPEPMPTVDPQGFATHFWRSHEEMRAGFTDPSQSGLRVIKGGKNGDNGNG